MTREKLYEVLGDINDRHVKEAREYHKGKRSVRFKWGAAAACLCLVIAAAGMRTLFYEHRDLGPADTVPAPMITIMGKDYIAPDMPVEELPAEYRYLRDLTEKEAHHTGLEGCAVYVDPQDGNMNAIYLYQECGTPIDEYTVDNTQRQWAYVRWVAVSEVE